MMRIAVSALAVGGTFARWSDPDDMKVLTARRHNLATQHQKGNENQDERKERVLSRILKRTRVEKGDTTSKKSDDALAARGTHIRPEAKKRGRAASGDKTSGKERSGGIDRSDGIGRASGKKKVGGSPAKKTGSATAAGKDAASGSEAARKRTPLLEHVVMGAAHGHSPKADKDAGGGNHKAKAPSNAGGGSQGTLSSPSSPSPPSPRGPKTDKGGSGKSGKSRKISSNICNRRLGIAYRQLLALGPDGPFGTITSPSDVTEKCDFFPPEDDEGANFGCPFFYVPGIGFLQTEEDYQEVLGDEPGEAFFSLVLYCQCYLGFELGCADKIPHGPPTGMELYSTPDGEPREVIVNGYSEYIPFSTPSTRAEYCKMVGVWNGDFESEVVEDLTEDVLDCGCYFTGEAKDMVSQCPGVDLGAFFVFPTTMPTPAPTPAGTTEYSFFDDFEDAKFPEGSEWSVATETLDNSDAEKGWWWAIIEEGTERARVLREVDDENESIRDGERELQQNSLPVWALTTDEAFSGVYSIGSPELNCDKFAIASVTLAVSEDWGTPGWLGFLLRTRPLAIVGWFVDDDDETYDAVLDESDWTQHWVWIERGEHTVRWEYVFFPDVPEQGAAFIDDVSFEPIEDIPTFYPTAMTELPTFNPTVDPTAEPTVDPTVGPSQKPTSDPTSGPT